LHNEELYYIYPTPNIIRMNKLMRWPEEVTRMDEKKNVYKVLVGNCKGKRSL
jgi:hypothetical protein